MDVPQKHGPSRPSIIPSMGLIMAFVVLVLAGAFTVYYLASSRTIPVLPTPASAQAQSTDSLFYLLLGIGGIVFFLVQGLLLYSVIRFRAQPNDTTDGPSIHGNATLEIVWTIIPAVVVVLLSGLSVVVWKGNTDQRPNENFIKGQTVDIHVLAQRFKWSFLYSTGVNDAKGNPITLVSPELHTYENQNVYLQMNAVDVIHSFWIPTMRVKQDVMPGKTTEIRFTPINTGLGYEFAYEFPEGSPLGNIVDIPADHAHDNAIANRFNQYQIVCAELCGGGHGEMHTKIIVHENEESFLKWYDAQVASLINPPDDPVLLGEQVLRSGAYPCASCHNLSSLGWTGNTGPNLDGIADRADRRAKSSALGDENGAAYIMHSIRYSQDYIAPPGGWSVQMPQFQDTDPNADHYMPDDHLRGIVAYLCTQTATGNVGDSKCGIDFGDAKVTSDELLAIQTKLIKP